MHEWHNFSSHKCKLKLSKAMGEIKRMVKIKKLTVLTIDYIEQLTLIYCQSDCQILQHTGKLKNMKVS